MLPRLDSCRTTQGSKCGSWASRRLTTEPQLVFAVFPQVPSLKCRASQLFLSSLAQTGVDLPHAARQPAAACPTLVVRPSIAPLQSHRDESGATSGSQLAQSERPDPSQASCTWRSRMSEVGESGEAKAFTRCRGPPTPAPTARSRKQSDDG